MGSDTEKHWIIFVCTSMNASYAAAEKSEWRMASKIHRVSEVISRILPTQNGREPLKLLGSISVKFRIEYELSSEIKEII